MNQNNWTIDTAHSAISFSIRHMVFAKVRGRFGTWNATADLVPEDLSRSKVEVEIDAASIDTGVADRDKHLRSADFFDADTFPKLRFVSTKVEDLGGGRYQVHGELTIRDVTKQIALEAQHGGQGKDPWGNQRIAFSGTTSLNRADFGLTWNQVLEAGGILVGERVDIEIDVQAVLASASAAA